jgi:alpha-amylase/alpha-mannosidase (GH57 family)
MPHTYLVFVWHMHQPFYKDLPTGEYQLPWTRLHALKDYYGMVKILEEFPRVRQTFNLVPSMIVQIDEYARGEARDAFLRCALKPAEELSKEEQAFALKYFFQANASRMIYRYPRYGELFDTLRLADYNPERARQSFGPQGMRDLQVLSQLAWFDEEFQEHDAQVKALAAKGRNYALEDQALMGRKQQECLAQVMPVYERFARRGQIEVSVTPYYHPILPLLCDSNIASVAHPHVNLPRRFRYPRDARRQIERARSYARERLGFTPDGMWPSEGSVSDEALALAADAGVKWMATDNGVLGATLGRIAGIDETYRPYVWKQGGREMKLIFRDHFLSDLIGFVYSRMEPAAAAGHFLDRIRENARHILSQGRDALVPVILDGENAWEHYELNGRPFLKELYRRISADPTMSAVTVSEALKKVPAQELSRIHPGSWINANFDVWIGAEEDNTAWEYLLEARETYGKVADSKPAQVSEDRLKLAYEELMIAEGSDWCWWYGPEHHSDNRPEFDKLFRDHLANVYRALDLPPPEELSRPILRLPFRAFHEPPAGLIQPVVDGEVSSYFEWLGAGAYRPDERQGSMHGRRFFIRQLMYGSDGKNLYIRLDLLQSGPGAMAGSEVRASIEAAGGTEVEVSFQLTRDGAEVLESRGMQANNARARTACAYRRIVEMKVELESLAASPHERLRIQLSLWRDGLPLDAVPAQGWLEFVPAEPAEWGE